MNDDWTERGESAVMCPYCLDPIVFDSSQLYSRNELEEFVPLDLSQEHQPSRYRDVLSSAFQRCPNPRGLEPHHLPVPYLIHGRPLTVAMVGSSFAGKTHLLASITAELEKSGLDPYGLTCKPLNPQWHQDFLKRKVQALSEGRVLARTTEVKFAEFADGHLISGSRGTRPLMFFDLAGENQVTHSEVNRFLTEVDAFIFVIDPLRALRLSQLDPVRESTTIPESDLGDATFATLLNRIPRSDGYVRAPVAVVVNKCDLVRFEPPVDRWLSQPVGQPLRDEVLRQESRDVYAFVRQHGSKAWLKPFTECERCTLHFVSATGGREQNGRFQSGVSPRRVLTPLLSILAMCGVWEGEELTEVGL